MILNDVQVYRVSNRIKCLAEAIVSRDGRSAEHLRRGDAREDPQDEDDDDQLDDCESGASHLIATAKDAICVDLRT